MKDIHSHVLFGVDDGAPDIDSSIEMLRAAKRANIDVLYATPHMYDLKQLGPIRSAFSALKPHADKEGIDLKLGFEVYYGAIASIGADELRLLTLGESSALLLEFDCDMLPPLWENMVIYIQRSGIDVIIAHPERYRCIQRNIDIAERMLELGCELQLDACAFFGRFFSSERRLAEKLIANDMAAWIASDAHFADDYAYFERATRAIGTSKPISGNIPHI